MYPSAVPSDVAQAIVERANETLAEYQRMRAWFVWPEEDFPRSSTQKPRRNVIRDAVEATLRGQAPASAASPLSELLTRITGRNVQNMHNLTPDANLESGLGLSSLERVELLSALEDRYQIDLSETKFAKAATVGDLEKLLQDGRSVVGRQSLVVGKTPERLATDDQRLTGAPEIPSFSVENFTLQLFTIRAGPCAGRPRGCAWRRIICWRARPCFFWDGPA